MYVFKCANVCVGNIQSTVMTSIFLTSVQTLHLQGWLSKEGFIELEYCMIGVLLA